MGVSRMRRATPEALDALKLALKRLEEDWPRYNRSSVNKGLRDSIYTKILETKAAIKVMEESIRKAERTATRAAARSRVKED